MLNLLDSQWGETGRASGRRKLRLFACICVRGIWSLLRQPSSANAVEVAERYADGVASEQDMADARTATRAATLREVGKTVNSGFYSSAAAAEGVVAERFQGRLPSVFHAQFEAATAWAHEQDKVGLFEVRVNKRQAVQANLLRDIFGSPFRRVTIRPAWRTPDVLRMATAAYEERSQPAGELDSQRLAVLADALEEVGCEADILNHLRGPGPHVRGCWAVDLILSKDR
jgi:hypothetical protein